MITRVVCVGVRHWTPDTLSIRSVGAIEGQLGVSLEFVTKLVGAIELVNQNDFV